MREHGERGGARFLQFAEAEHQRLLRASYLIGCVLFVIALLGEQFAFGPRFGMDDLSAAGLFVLAQALFLGWRMGMGLPALNPLGRAAVIVANGWMWALLSALHTYAGDSAPYVYEFVVIQIVFCYFFSGLVQRVAIFSGLAIGLILPLALIVQGEASAGVIARASFVLFSVNVIGSAGRWWIEQNQRAQFAVQLALRSQAMTDPLTGIANRRGLHHGLEAAAHMAQREGQHLGIAILDLDKFKPVNDRFGHAAGDAVLREVAARLRSVARRDSDTVARLGGDEFAVVWAARSVADLYRLAEQLHEAMKDIVLQVRPGDDGIARTSASLGVLVVRKPTASLDLSALLHATDGLSMMVKRIGGREMVVREWSEPRMPWLRPARSPTLMPVSPDGSSRH